MQVTLSPSSMSTAVVCMLVASACASTTATDAAPHHPHDGHSQGFHRRFENAGEWSKVFDAPDRDAWQRPEDVTKLLAIAPGMMVADVGAGTGYFLPYLSRAVGPGGRVLALDIEPDMVAYMKTRIEKESLANVEARIAQASDPELGTGVIDRILIVDTWHHIDDRAFYSTKLKQALKPDGAVYIVDFTLDAGRGPPKEHRLAPERVIAELKEAGLDGEVLEETLPDQYVVRGFIAE